MDEGATLDKIRNLPLWAGEVFIAPLGGGRTNLNFTVTDERGKYVVRIGEDIPRHHVLRFNERAASRAACAAGLSPELVFSHDGISVLAYIPSRTLSESDVGTPEYLPRIISLMRRCHYEIPKHYRGPSLVFWVFHIIRDYAATLIEGESTYRAMMPEFLRISAALEQAAGPFDIVFGHNDMMAANILDDGARLWLIDWDYAGFNSPLFDLGGLASNNSLNAAQESEMLELYFDAPLTAETFHKYLAMKCASLLRETLWSMVSEMTSSLDVDYASYTAENLERFRAAYSSYLQS